MQAAVMCKEVYTHPDLLRSTVQQEAFTGRTDGAFKRPRPVLSQHAALALRLGRIVKVVF